MKFESLPAVSGPSAAGGDGVFDVDVAAVSAVVLDTDTEAADFESLAVALSQELAGLVEDCRSDVIGAQLGQIAVDLVQHGMDVVQRRTGNAVNAVGEVLMILQSADATMSDTARTAAAGAAQTRADDDPYAFERPTFVRGQANPW